MKKEKFDLVFFALVAGFSFLVSCSEDGNRNSESVQESISQNIFSTSLTAFQVHSFYEEGAEPYVGALGLSGNDTWDVTKTSYESLFQGHIGRGIQVPSNLSQMSMIGDQDKSSWTSSELRVLGEGLVQNLIENSSVNISIIFLNGLYNGNSSVLGIHISGTHFAFVFKDVVVSVGGDDTSQKYVEQATVVHEIGHAIGLVNNGVPMAVAHEDSEHAHHTTNSDGVMYWAVESSSGILSFLTDIITGGELNLFGPESLADAQGYQPE